MTVDGFEPTALDISWSPFGAGRYTPVAPGVAMPGAFTAEITLQSSAKAVMEVEVIDRVPRCIAITLRGGIGGVTSTSVRLPVQRWLDFVCARTAVVVEPGTAPGESVLRPPGDKAETGRVTKAATTAVRRRTIDDDLLRRAADAYKENKVAGIMGACFVGEAQAYRYLRAARERGLLPQRGEN
jgi:hypothetical protein